MAKKLNIQKKSNPSIGKPKKNKVISKKVINEFSDGFIQYTIETWQPYYHKKLNKNDAIEITNNMTSLFILLIETQQEEKGKIHDK